MKIIIAWDKERSGGKIARGVVGHFAQQTLVAEGYAYGPNAYLCEPDLSQQYIEFDAEDFTSGIGAVRAVDIAIQQNYGIRTFVAVQVVPGRQFERLEDFAAEQELHAKRRLKAMQNAIDSLKQTRSWFKDKRLAEIRRRLEQNLY